MTVFSDEVTSDWRDHVDQEIRTMWPYLDHLDRMIVYITAITNERNSTIRPSIDSNNETGN